MITEREDVTMDSLSPIIRFAQVLTVLDSEQFGTQTAYDNRMFLCIEGEGEIVISDIPYAVSSGTVIMWQGGLPYRYEPSAGSYLKLIGFNFDFTSRSSNKLMAIPPAKVEMFRSYLLTECVEFSDTAVLNKPLCICDQLHLVKKFEAIKNEFLYKKKFYIKRCSGLLSDLIVSFVRKAEMPPDILKRKEIVNKMIQYIHENYASELSNESLARVFGYHPGYMGRLMKEATDMSIHQYLLQYRIERAIDLLQSGQRSVSETCYLCGFKDLAHFSKCFKLKTGYSPSYYCV